MIYQSGTSVGVASGIGVEHTLKFYNPPVITYRNEPMLLLELDEAIITEIMKNQKENPIRKNSNRKRAFSYIESELAVGRLLRKKK